MVCRSRPLKSLVGKKTPDCMCWTVHQTPELARSIAQQIADQVVYKNKYI